MVDIRPLKQFSSDDLHRLATGYTSDVKYKVMRTESDGHFSLTLELTSLPQPYRKRYDVADDELLMHYQQVAQLGLSFGAYDGSNCVGIVIAEPRSWNRSLWVWELHVDQTYRRRSLGRNLVEALVEEGRAYGLRTLVCETQNTNVPAIRFYRSMGFRIEGLDLSYYSNDDYPDGEVAVFMKKTID